MKTSMQRGVLNTIYSFGTSDNAGLLCRTCTVPSYYALRRRSRCVLKSCVQRGGTREAVAFWKALYETRLSYPCIVAEHGLAVKAVNEAAVVASRATQSWVWCGWFDLVKSRLWFWKRCIFSLPTDLTLISAAIGAWIAMLCCCWVDLMWIEPQVACKLSSGS